MLAALQAAIEQEPRLTVYGLLPSKTPCHAEGRQKLLDHTKQFVETVQLLDRWKRTNQTNRKVTTSRIAQFISRNQWPPPTGVIVAAAIHLGIGYQRSRHSYSCIYLALSSREPSEN